MVHFFGTLRNLWLAFSDFALEAGRHEMTPGKELKPDRAGWEPGVEVRAIRSWLYKDQRWYR